MRAFTHDRETIVLTEAEMTAFSGIVITETERSTRMSVSRKLESVTGPVGSAAAGYVFCQAKMMWRNLEGTG